MQTTQSTIMSCPKCKSDYRVSGAAGKCPVCAEALVPGVSDGRGAQKRKGGRRLLLWALPALLVAFVLWTFVSVYLDRLDRGHVVASIHATEAYRKALVEYSAKRGRFPGSEEEMDKSVLPESSPRFKYKVDSSGVMTIEFGQATRLAGQTIVFRPVRQDGGTTAWDCTGGTVESKNRPGSCR